MKQVKRAKRICCVEGLYEDEGEHQPTIRPMLDMLSQWKYWPHCYRRCTVVEDMNCFLEERWPNCGYNSVLFFAMHGDRGEITLGEESIRIDKLGREDALQGQCEGCLVHFSACRVIRDEAALHDFLRATGAAAVSGYAADVGWAGSEQPALLSDLMLLNELWEAEINFSDGRSLRKLERIERNVQRRFGDCQFGIHWMGR